MARGEAAMRGASPRLPRVSLASPLRKPKPRLRVSHVSSSLKGKRRETQTRRGRPGDVQRGAYSFTLRRVAAAPGKLHV